MYYQNLFNQNYINEAKYQEVLKKTQIEQQIMFDQEQKKEIAKMLKALDDYFNAAQKIAPQYQNDAFNACVLKISQKLYNK